MTEYKKLSIKNSDKDRNDALNYYRHYIMSEKQNYNTHKISLKPKISSVVSFNIPT